MPDLPTISQAAAPTAATGDDLEETTPDKSLAEPTPPAQLPAEADYQATATAPLGAQSDGADISVVEPADPGKQTRRVVLSSHADNATAAAVTAAERARTAAERARAASRRRADESITRIEGLVERFDGFASKHQLSLPGEVEAYDSSTPLSRRKIDPAPLIIGLAVIFTVIALILAVVNLLPSGGSRPAPTPTAPVAPAEESPSSEESPAADEGEQAEKPAPEISNMDVLDPQGDGAENPELLSRAFDGDQETYWRSRSYVDPEYGMKDGIGVAIKLVAKTEVSSITLHLHGTGGHVQVTTNVADPAAGPVLAEADMSETTELTFDAVEAEEIALWFTSLPKAASDGKNRVELQEVVLK